MKTKEYLSSPPIIRDFLIYNETVRNKSSKTVTDYFLDLRIFFRFIKLHYGIVDNDTEFEKISIDDIDIVLVKRISLSDVFMFMIYLKNVRLNNDRSRARRTSALKQYFSYLTNRANLLETNPIKELDSPKLKKSLPKHLTLEQSFELLNSVDGNYKERNFAIITIFLNCGLRLSELCGLNLGDIRDDNTMKVTGKGNKERIVYINDACVSAINEYKKVRPNDGVKDKDALFLSRFNKRISNRMVQVVIENHLKKSGLGGMGYSTHKLRHTAATLMYQHGNVDIRVLKDLLGHENLGTTEIYTHLSNAQLEEAAKANPLSQFNKRKD